MPFCSTDTEGPDSSGTVDYEAVKREWRLLWRDRIDDKVVAEGIANRDYALLFAERGLVVIATRDYKPLNLKAILRQHGIGNVERVIPPHPSVGGWGKFARTVLNRQTRVRRWKDSPPPRSSKGTASLQLKKGGRGWLHYQMKR